MTRYELVLAVLLGMRVHNFFLHPPLLQKSGLKFNLGLGSRYQSRGTFNTSIASCVPAGTKRGAQATELSHSSNSYPITLNIIM